MRLNTKKYYTALFFILCMITFPLCALAEDISISVFPSASPLSKKYENEFYNAEYKNLNVNDISQLNLAFKKRDLAWKMSEKLLSGIRHGNITDKNITNYATDELKQEIEKNPTGVSFAMDMIKSYGNKATLSTKYDPKHAADYMVLQKKQDRIIITTVNRPDRLTEEQIYNNVPQAIITITLTAKYPYQKWLLSGIHFYMDSIGRVAVPSM